MVGKKNFTLVRRPASAVEKAAPSAKRVLAGTVAETLALAEAKSTPNIEKIKTALKGSPWTNGAPTKVKDGIRQCDSVSMLLLRAGVPEYEVSTLKMSDTWTRFGALLKNEYGLRDIVDYYLVLIAGDSSSSADDMIFRVEKALVGDLTAIAPSYRAWISKMVSDRKTLSQRHPKL